MTPSPSEGPQRTDGEGHTAQEAGQRSGEGAQTALEALIRKRRMAENPQGPEPETGIPTKS
jgi:hypothetical protein